MHSSFKPASAERSFIWKPLPPVRTWGRYNNLYEDASIAVFQHDQETFALKDPCIIPLESNLVLRSTSGVWENAMMKRSDQQPPMASICVVKNSSGGYTLLFPDGLGKLTVIVDNQRLSLASQRLTGGELVRVYCNYLFNRIPLSSHPGSIRKDELIGPLIFQYRAEGWSTDWQMPDLYGESYAGPPRVGLDKLPPEVLQTIFSYLPADEVLRNIPAVCTKFLEAVRKMQPFSRWEITGKPLAPQEMVFLQGWTSRPVSQLILRFPYTHVSCTSQYMLQGVRMERSRKSITSIEIDARDIKLPGSLANDRDRWVTHYVSNLILAKDPRHFPKCFKLQGVPVTAIDTVIGEHLCLNLERLWVGFYQSAAVLPPTWAPSWFTTVPKELKVVAFRFELASKSVLASNNSNNEEREHSSRSSSREDTGQSHERNEQAVKPAADRTIEVQPEPPCDIEALFNCLCPAEASNRKRVLILDAKGKAWKTCIDMLSKLKTLHALWISVSTKEFLRPSEVKRLVNCLPSSLQVLRVTPKKNDELFNDELCLALAVQCPDLEIFVCHESGRITQKGVRTLTIGCENLKRLALLHWENELQVLREDVLPERLQKGVRLYEDELQRVFE